MPVFSWIIRDNTQGTPVLGRGNARAGISAVDEHTEKLTCLQDDVILLHADHLGDDRLASAPPGLDRTERPNGQGEPLGDDGKSGDLDDPSGRLDHLGLLDQDSMTGEEIRHPGPPSA